MEQQNDYAEDSDNNKSDQIFRPPSHFIKASEARQAKLKQMQDDRQQQQQQQAVAVDTQTKSPVQQRRKPSVTSSPPTAATTTTTTTTTRARGPSLGASSGSSSEQQGSPQMASTSSSVRPVPVRLQASIAATSPSQSPAAAAAVAAGSPSKIVQEIDQIRLAREERRAVQAEFRKIKEGLDDNEQETIGYRYLIDRFREQLSLGVEEASATSTDTVPAAANSVIQVCVRKRPLSKRELDAKTSGQFDVITTPQGISSRSKAVLFVHEPKCKFDLTKSIDNHTFQFDHVMDETVDNEQVYTSIVRPLVEVLFRQNGRATLFAYGQTGSGKTHTIFGSASSGISGIYHFIGQDAFRLLERYNKSMPKGRLGLYCSFFEIYGGHVYDLLNNRRRVNMLENRQGHSQLSGITEAHLQSVESMHRCLETGQRSRSTGATDANPESSRSHAVFQLSLKSLPPASVGGEHQEAASNATPILGQFSLIDLAGSEKASEANASNRQTRIEGAEINKSLLALKECIRALGNPNSKHVPFRASKLTKVLKDSLDITKYPDRASNQQMVVMIATISPNSDSVEHTLNTLRYAYRVKEFRPLKPGGGAAGANLPRVPGNMVYDPKEMIQRSSSAEKLDSPATAKQQIQPSKTVPSSTSRRSSAEELLQDAQDLEYLHSNLDEEENVPELKRLHTAVQAIVDDEDALIHAHITCLQKILAISREEEEKLLADVSQPGYDLDEYLEGLESALIQKQILLNTLQKRLADFKSNLQNY